jgi:hypothetical protein
VGDFRILYVTYLHAVCFGDKKNVGINLGLQEK